MGRISLKSRRAVQRRRRALAGLAGISLSLLIACWSASAASAPSAPALPLPSALPTLAHLPTLPPKPVLPTPPPCPSALPLPILPTPPGCPAIVPPARPGITPPPSLPSPPGSSLRGAGLAAGVAPGSAAVPGAASAGGLPLASLQQSSLLQLLGLLGTPPNVGVEAPNLEHFGAASGNGTPVTTATSPSVAQPSSLAAAPAHLPSQLWLALVLSLLAALGLTIFGRRTGRARIARGALIASAPFLLAIVAGAVASAPTSDTVLMPHRFVGAAQAAPAAQAVQVARVPVLRPAETVSHEVSTPGQALLAQATAFETQVASDQAQIQALTTLAQNQPDQLSGRSQGTASVDGGGPTATMRAVASSLEWTLQQEYNFYLNAARSPAQATGLVGAAASKSGAVRDAFSYNVQAVEAQLAQEAAIAQAAQGAPGATVSAPGGQLAPLNGPISQPFGPSALAFEPAVTFNGISYPHFHTGIDIAGPLDAPLHSAADGVVAIAGTEVDNQGRPVGYGNYVVIAHAGRMVTLYGHLDQLLVHVGQVVHAGQVIGLEGSTGNSTGPHLHFELHVAGLLTDPAKYVRSQLAAA